MDAQSKPKRSAVEPRNVTMTASAHSTKRRTTRTGGRLPQVHGHRSLVASQHLPPERMTSLAGTHPPGIVTGDRGLDMNHVSAKVRQ